jgi:hypothetical protein
MLRRIARDPLTHFLAIGLLLFALYAVIGGKGDQRSIRVDDNVAASLYSQFQKTWQRAPTAGEMSALVDSYVRDEIFYREGVGLGLDRDDSTIKRRVSQKFTTIAEEAEAADAPSDADLNGWLAQHSARYADPALVTFDQVGFAPAAYGEVDADVLKSARHALAGGADPGTLGNVHMLLPHFELYPIDLIQRDFGPIFAQTLLSVKPGGWEGPVRSGYGIHLIRVGKVVPGRVPPLDAVRAAVARDYEAARRSRSVEATYRKLRREYRVEYTGSWKPAQQ